MSSFVIFWIGELFTFVDPQMALEPWPSCPGATICVRFYPEWEQKRVQRAGGVRSKRAVMALVRDLLSIWSDIEEQLQVLPFPTSLDSEVQKPRGNTHVLTPGHTN